MTLSPKRLKKAVRLNPYYERTTGWSVRFEQVNEELESGRQSLGPEAFATARPRGRRSTGRF